MKKFLERDDMLETRDGILGLCVGDALGVPVEFYPRKRLEAKPVTDIMGYGTHNQPPGTWSDDSSLALCLAESLCEGYDLANLAEKFCAWLFDAYWTPHGKIFDVGMTTREAIFRLKKGVNPVEAGGKDEYSNGNGSLMRILPLAYLLYNQKDIFPKIQDVSCLTHAHPRSQLGCAIYIQYALFLLKEKNRKKAYRKTVESIMNYYHDKEPFKQELKHYDRILKHDISKLSSPEIHSGGYVQHTLEASLWCLFQSSSYKETILKAINLGKDTDTTAAVAGGLAGIYYGYETIPKHWIANLARKDDILALADKLSQSLQ